MALLQQEREQQLLEEALDAVVAMGKMNKHANNFTQWFLTMNIDRCHRGGRYD